MKPNDKIIERIRKLLSLSDSDNENEAKLATERANELLTRYNLSMQSIGKDSEIGETAIDMGKRAPVEQKFICTILGKYFFVSFIQGARIAETPGWITVKTLRFVGERTNVEVAVFTYHFLQATFRSLWKKYKTETFALETARQSYYLGLMRGIMDQLKVNRQSVEQSTGLVVVPDAQLKAYLARLSLAPCGRTTKIRNDAHASSHGYSDGKNLNIMRGIRSQENARASGLQLTGR